MLENMASQAQFGYQPKNGEKVMVEYSSPNTNKPLHLGHVRNILLGWSSSKILAAAGYDVVKVQVINDRGVHICKSMWAWEKFGNGETPESTGMKGDHLVGKYYVKFNDVINKEYLQWQSTEEAFHKFISELKKVKKSDIEDTDWHKGGFATRFAEIIYKNENNLNEISPEHLGKFKYWKNKHFKNNFDTFLKTLENHPDSLKYYMQYIPKTAKSKWVQFPLGKYIFKTAYKNKYFNENSPVGAEVTEMLQKWEANDAHVRALWEMMNSWVYAGFEETYKSYGISFDKYYYESNTYKLGKDAIEGGLKKGVFYKNEDGSTWADLTDVKMDKKIVLRSNGTSVYITQDIGTAQKRYEDFGVNKMIYVVGNEQEYHFQVLFEILKRLEEPYADGLHHLSYGMVELPTGKMKSREGTVVDADDLLVEVQAQAKAVAEESGGLEGLDEDLVNTIHYQIGLGALKFFILKVNPKRGMVFNPEDLWIYKGKPNVRSVCCNENQSDCKKSERSGFEPSCQLYRRSRY